MDDFSPAPSPQIIEGGPGQVVELPAMPAEDTVAWSERLLATGTDVLVPVAAHPLLGVSLAGARRRFVRLTARRSSVAVSAAFRVRDLTVAWFVLMLTVPLLVASAVAIRLSSPGPIFFTAKVIGRDEQPFTWRKLRTMRVVTGGDALERRELYARHVRGESSGKVIDETRVTPVGRWLRKHSIDELPQLLNVLRGEMTLVGPRPCLPYELELSQPWHRLRYRATPGVTGPWQAYGRSRASYDEMALLDYCYAHSRSFRRDMRILQRTVMVVITGEGGR